MKAFQSVLVLLPLVVEGARAPTPLLKRQWVDLEKWLKDTLKYINDKEIKSSMKKNVTKIQELEPTLNITGVKSRRYIYGPYTIYGLNSTEKKGSMFAWPPNWTTLQNMKPGDALSLDKDGTSYTNTIGNDFLSDATVLRVETGLLTKDFKIAGTKEGIFNHHNLWFDLTKTSHMAFGCDFWPSAMADIPMPSRNIFSNGGSDGVVNYFANPNEAAGDVKTGYYLSKDRVIMNMVDVVNYNKEDQQIYQFIDMEYLDGKQQGRLDQIQVVFDPFMCNLGKNGRHTGLLVQPDKAGQKKWTAKADGIVVQRNGYLVSMRGHVHDGGENIIMRVNGKEVCNSRALYGGPEHTAVGPDGKVWETIREMTNCHYTTKVNRGDKISVEANYDLEKYPSRLIPSNKGGDSSGHSGHGPSASGSRTRFKRDVLEGEQMAFFSVYFAEEALPKK